MRALLICFAVIMLVVACQKIVVINDSPGENEVEAPSPLHLDMEREVQNERSDDD